MSEQVAKSRAEWNACLCIRGSRVKSSKINIQYSMKLVFVRENISTKLPVSMDGWKFMGEKVLLKIGFWNWDGLWNYNEINCAQRSCFTRERYGQTPTHFVPKISTKSIQAFVATVGALIFHQNSIDGRPMSDWNLQSHYHGYATTHCPSHHVDILTVVRRRQLTLILISISN